MDQGSDFVINERSYAMYVRSLQILESCLGINIKIHTDDDTLDKGQIFLFNHFARFETIIPPYLIYRATGAYSRSVADHNLFKLGDGFSRFLSGGGAVPDNLPGLLPFLAAEILRGRKVIIFPEGAMIKDRRVVDEKGRFRIFSPVSLEYRKHHQGAAVLALTLDLFKRRIKDLFLNGDTDRIEHWRDALGLESEEALLLQTNKPTLIIPATITFNPIRISDNILSRGIEFFTKNIPDSLAEELAVEGNLLFRETDMDIRFGDPLRTQETQVWHWWQRMLLNRYFLTINSLNDLFGLKKQAHSWSEQLLAHIITKGSKRIRDAYMKSIYSGITVNLNHLASVLIMALVEKNRMEIPAREFHKIIYLALKKLQKEPNVHIHRGIDIPDRYRGLLAGENKGLNSFLDTCQQAGLAIVGKEAYRFLPKLEEEHGFDEIRLENPVMVHANEVAPISQVRKAVDEAVTEVQTIEETLFASYLFDDELRSFAWNQKRFTKKQFQEINRNETATNSGEPFLLLPKKQNKAGVLLVHGFLASPAELYGLGEKLHGDGHAVLGVRLAGHGTSPWDLQERQWDDWFNSVKRGYKILSTLTEQVVIVGFSAGGLLALLLGAEQPEKLIGIASVSTPLSVKDSNLTFVPMVHFLNKIVRYIPGVEGVKPFYKNVSSYPETNYHTVPLSALNQFRTMMKAMRPKLPEVRMPVIVLQGDSDPVVRPQSGKVIFDEIFSKNKALYSIKSERHGIIYENIGETWSLIEKFIQHVSED